MSSVQRCPECNSINLTYDEEKGEVICNDCGLLIEEKMVDTGIDLSGKFDKSEKKGRGGAPINMQKFDKGLTTNVGEISDIYKLDTKQTRKFLRLKKWQERVSTSIERNLRLAMAKLKIKVTPSSPKDYISRFSSILHLSPKAQN